MIKITIVTVTLNNVKTIEQTIKKCTESKLFQPRIYSN